MSVTACTMFVSSRFSHYFMSLVDCNSQFSSSRRLISCNFLFSSQRRVLSNDGKNGLARDCHLIQPFKSHLPQACTCPRTEQEGTLHYFWHQVLLLGHFLTLKLVNTILQFYNYYVESQRKMKHSLANNYMDVDVEEMYTFVALLTYMSLVWLPHPDLYWSTQQLFHGLWASAFISKFRYK